MGEDGEGATVIDDDVVDEGWGEERVSVLK